MDPQHWNLLTSSARSSTCSTETTCKSVTRYYIPIDSPWFSSNVIVKMMMIFFRLILINNFIKMLFATLICVECITLSTWSKNLFKVKMIEFEEINNLCLLVMPKTWNTGDYKVQIRYLKYLPLECRTATCSEHHFSMWQRWMDRNCMNPVSVKTSRFLKKKTKKYRKKITFYNKIYVLGQYLPAFSIWRHHQRNPWRLCPHRLPITKILMKKLNHL